MLRAEMIKRSPLRVLEERMHGGLGKGNLGVFAAGHGTGKTACLVHVAVDSLLQGKQVLHLSFYDKPDHVLSWYENIFAGMAKAYHLESASDIHDEIARHRLVVNFKAGKLDLDEIRKRILEMLKDLNFKADVLVVDGYDFEKASPDALARFKTLAVELDVETWFSQVLNREDVVPRKEGLPEGITAILPHISAAIHLDTRDNSILLRILVEHGRESNDDSHVRLSPTTFLMEGE